MQEAKPAPGPHPDEANKTNEKDASDADKRTIDTVRKNETVKEKTEGEYRPPS